MKKQKISVREVVVVFLLVSIIQLLSYIPVYRMYKEVPPGYTYYGAPPLAIDFLGTMSIAQQGYQGRLQDHLEFREYSFEKEEDKKLILVKMEYLFIGHLARIFRIDVLWFMYITRFIFSLITLGVFYFFISTFIYTRSMRLITFFLTLFSTSITLPQQSYFDSMINVVGDSLVPYQRFSTVLHHYLLGYIFSILAIHFLSKTLSKRSFKNILLMIFSAVVASFLFAPSVFMIIASFPFYYVFTLIHEGFKKKTVRKLVSQTPMFFIFTIVSALPALHVRFTYMSYLSEALVYTKITSTRYVLGVGMLFITTLLSFVPVFKYARSTRFRLILPWVIAHPLVTLTSEQVLSISARRFFQTPFHVIFSIISVSGLSFVLSRIKVIQGVWKNIVIMAYVCVIVFSGLYSYRYWFAKECFCNGPPFSFAYPTTDTYLAIEWLKNNTEKNDIVLSGLEAGFLIPALSGNKIFISWWTRLADARHYFYARMQDFYNGNMPDTGIKDFLRTYDITYVYYGDEEQKYQLIRGRFPYFLLQEVYSKGKVKIYKVRKDLL